MPSRQEVLAFLRTHPGAGKREIVRAFDLGSGERAALKDLLRELADEGLVDRRKKRLHVPGALPAVVVAEITGRDSEGELLAEPVEWDAAEHGPPPKVRVHIPRQRRAASPPPGVGDRVLLKTEESADEAGHVRHAGRVLKVLDKSKARILGLYRRLPGGGGRLVPVDKKSLGRELSVPAGAEGQAEDGDLVSADLVRQGRFGLNTARVRERLGSIASERAISLIALNAHGIPHVFSPAVLAEAEAARPAPLDDYEDWRALPLVTIDPADAKDHDDAVHAAPDPDPGNPGGFILTVAIADVARYVRPGSALDREAKLRGNSVYFPDRVVPMLPERISNNLCSLRPNEERPALAVRMVISDGGKKLRHTFHRVMMRSAAKLAYPQAQGAIDGRPDEATAPLIEGVLRPLWAAYAALKEARAARGPLDLDLPERKVILKPDGSVDRVIVPERLDAHRLIEEFMILANVAAAETLEHKKTPLVYRVHDQPSLEKLESLRTFLATLDIALPKAPVQRPSHFNSILARVAGSDTAQLVNEVILRSQAQAEYAAENYGHFGLNLRRYAHFTSPIRRYADLIVHRAMIRALKLGDGALPESITREELAETAAEISVAERRAMAAERDTVDRLIAHHLADRIGASFEGRIAGMTRAGLFVKLAETGADGFVPAATIGADFFRFEENRMALVGERTGETFRLGDTVTVKLVEAAPVAGALRFELLSEGRLEAPAPRSGKRAVRRLTGKVARRSGRTRK
ncbi:ribonuclease R [Blastochloris sulfoviridis]|uniref:Ribonuclease R n=1 Tax=Blastochloris sulfoviridis TaxID=50712 RepID=A0A5M6HTQ8_9HYPH|nr:ribonuclease R [Blastochloris sulfoviridis]